MLLSSLFCMFRKAKQQTKRKQNRVIAAGEYHPRKAYCRIDNIAAAAGVRNAQVHAYMSEHGITPRKINGKDGQFVAYSIAIEIHTALSNEAKRDFGHRCCK